MSKSSFLLAIILLGAVAVGASSVKEKRNSNVVVNPKELGFYPSGSEETREIHGRELYTQDYAMFTKCSAGLPYASTSAKYDGVVANSCYLCANAAHGTVDSCYFTLTQSGNTLTASFDTYTDTSCSAGQDTYISNLAITVGECLSSNDKLSLHSDVSDVNSLLPTEGLKRFDYASDCSVAPVGFTCTVYEKDTCSGDTGDGSSAAVRSCDGTTFKYDTYTTIDCSGSATAQTIDLGTCMANTSPDGFIGFSKNADDDTPTEYTTTKEYAICTALAESASDTAADSAAADLTIIIIVVVVVGCCACLGGIAAYVFLSKKQDSNKPAKLAAAESDAGAVESGGVPVVKSTELATSNS